MYKIYADNTLIYDSTLDDYKIGKGTISHEINKSGSFIFSIYPNHFYYDSFVKLKTIITVHRDGKIVFRGRILNDVTDYWNNKVITCEGELGFLQDSVIRPFKFSGSPLNLFTKFVNEHNSQVDEFKRFKIGKVTVADSTYIISRDNTEYESTLSNLNSRLIDNSLGGFFYITHGDDGTDEIPTINYLADSVKVASQTVEFGSNLRNYVKTVKAEELATAIIPLGEENLTITSVNNGKDYVYSAEGVALYGWIFKAVPWDNETVAANLKSKAEAYLSNIVTQNVTVELNAIDLHLLDRSIESFNICDYVRVISKPHNFDATLLCNHQTLDLLKPENDSLILGYAISTITGRTSEVSSSVKAIRSETKNIASSVKKINDDYVTSSQLTATVDTYLNSEEGRASIESAVSGAFVTTDKLNGYVLKTDLSTSIGQYIDTQAGTAKIISAVEGTFVKEDTLGNYVEKTDLSTEIGQYIDTDAGTAKIVSAISGTYQKKDDMSNYVTTTTLNASIGEYIDTQAGTAKIVQTISGTYVTQTTLTDTLSDYATNSSVNNALKNYIQTTELNAGIETYISGSEGKAKIISTVSGTYVTQTGLNTALSDYAKTDDLSDYLAKTELNAGIESYIDTANGKAAVISAVSGKYVTNENLTSTLGSYALKTDIPSLDDYLLESEVNASIESYIETATGKASIVSAVSGTYVTKSSFTTTLGDYLTETELNTTLSSYVKTTSLDSSIGTYIDSTTGKAKVISACSGTYVTESDLSGYAKTSAISTIEQSVSDVEAAITLSSTYSKNTIGTNVYALLQLVSNANSSTIKIKADKIDFTGFTTFLKASDLGSSGSTTIDGGRITTGTISADRIDVSNLKVNTIYGKGSYSSYTAMTTDGANLYVGGASFSPSYNNIYLAASNKIYFGSTGLFEICIDTASESLYSTHTASLCGTSTYPWAEMHCGGKMNYHIVISNTVIRPYTSSTSYDYSLGTSLYPWNAVYTKKLYLNGTEFTGGGSFAGSAVTMGGSSSYYIQATTNRELCPNSSSSYNSFYLGTSTYYWHYAYIGSTETRIGNSSSSKIGFFGTSPIARQTLSTSYNDMSYSSVTSSNYLTVLNNLVGILKNKYGLIY